MLNKDNRKELLNFADHLNTYKGLEKIRFDFMVQDYLDKLSELTKYNNYVQNLNNKS